MSNVNQNNQNVKPIRFELVDEEPERTVGDVIFGTISDIIKCPRCRTKHIREDDIYCNYCIDDIINDEGE